MQEYWKIFLFILSSLIGSLLFYKPPLFYLIFGHCKVSCIIRKIQKGYIIYNENFDLLDFTSYYHFFKINKLNN